MRVLIRQVARREGGALEYRDTGVEGAEISIGRGADQDIVLPGAGVSLRHARLRGLRDGGCEISNIGIGELRVNGKPVGKARIEPGDEIGIGAHRARRIAPPPGFDLALELEVAAEPEDAGPSSAELQKRLGAGWKTRRWSWVLGLVFLCAGLVVPLVGAYAPPLQEALRLIPLMPSDHWWDSGPLIPAHMTPPAGANCTACHRSPFRMVGNAACGECHGDATQHAAPDSGMGAELAARRCASCHKEHGGLRAIVRSDSGFCTDCHASLRSALGDGTALRDAKDFARDHPEFRVSLLHPGADGADAGEWGRVRVDIGAAELRERSNLIYDHKVHLDPEGVDTPEGKAQLSCGNCHEADASGVAMRPVSMKQHCSECHTLQFEGLSLPHASVDQVLHVLRGYYHQAVPAAGIREDVMVSRKRLARRPGEAPPEAAGTPEEKAQRAARDLFERTLCAVCHRMERRGAGRDASWRVEPVRLSQDWMPLAYFSHKSHQQKECTDCHGAAESERSEDVLMPGIEVCRECHIGGRGTAGVVSPCIQCHRFHVPGNPGLFAKEEPAAAEVAYVAH